jgi:hypothetical protein
LACVLNREIAESEIPVHAYEFPHAVSSSLAA